MNLTQYTQHFVDNKESNAKWFVYATNPMGWPEAFYQDTQEKALNLSQQLKTRNYSSIVVAPNSRYEVAEGVADGIKKAVKKVVNVAARELSGNTPIVVKTADLLLKDKKHES